MVGKLTEAISDRAKERGHRIEKEDEGGIDERSVPRGFYRRFSRVLVGDSAGRSDGGGGLNHELEKETYFRSEEERGKVYNTDAQLSDKRGAQTWEGAPGQGGLGPRARVGRRAGGLKWCVPSQGSPMRRKWGKNLKGNL